MHSLIKVKNKKVLVASILILLGIIIGVIYYNLLTSEIKNNIIYTLNNSNSFIYNSIIKDLLLTSLTLVTSFFLVGLFIGIIYLIYEGMSIGLLIAIFYNTYKFKGLLFILIYIIINKLLILFLLTLFIFKIINISRYVVGLFIYKKDNYLKEKIFINFKKSLFIIILILIVNVILYFISPILSGVLTNILK